MIRVLSTVFAIILTAAIITVMVLPLSRKKTESIARPPVVGESIFTVKATDNGFIIKSPAADIATMTSVIVCVPPFREKYFYNIKENKLEYVNTPERAEIIQTGTKDYVDIKEYSVAKEGENSLTLSLRADLMHSGPTDMENTLFVAPEYLLSDSKFRATLADGREISGVIPPAFEGEIEVKHIFENAVWAEFENNYGTLTLKVIDGPPFLVGDRRGVVFEERRCFWIGHQVPMKQGEKYESKVMLTYTPSPEISYTSPLSTVTEQAELKTVDNAVVNFELEYPLIPVPKAVEFFAGKKFDTNRNINISVNVNSAYLNRAVEKFVADASTEKNEEAKAGAIRIEIGEKGVGMKIPPDHAEGYVLSVEENEILIVSRSERGAFYALQTLKGLLRNGKFQSALIRDWPDLDMRAVHFMLPDRDAYALLSRIITEVMVPMKMNAFIMECEFVHWESIPNLHVKWGLSKEDCIKLIQLCEENYIDPIPLIQTLSHVPWLFQNQQNLDMCEDPRNPYCYFTSHPDLYPLMEKVCNEVMETFRNPRYMHIGHDELYTWAQYPNRPESIAIGTPKLVFDDVMWYYNYAKKRNAQIMMWHDIFVTLDESPENGHGGGSPDWVDTIRPDLPRDIVFCVWRYAGKTTEFKDLTHLAAEGFDVMGSSWFEINNVERLTKATKAVGGKGMISTTWIYPILDPQDSAKIETGCFDALEKWFIQMAPYTRSGAWSWNSNDLANRDLNGKELFASLLEPGRNTGVHRGATVDISNIANLPITESTNPFLINELYGFNNLPSGLTRVGRVLFDIPQRDGTLATVALKSRLNPKFPDAVKLDIAPSACRKIYFLHTALGIQPDPKATVASYVITYEDNTQTVFPVRYQWEIATPEEDVNYLLSTGNRLSWKYGKQGMSLWYCTFDNPEPNKKIISIELKGTPEEYPFYLFGITLEN